MNYPNTSEERRRHPRITEQLPFTLKAEDFDTVTETINLSCLGAYCQLDRHIPLMTRLKIGLALPRDDKKREFEYIECRGVVVRVEKRGFHFSRAIYNTAIYFNEIEESEREKIAKLVENRTGQPNHSYPLS